MEDRCNPAVRRGSVSLIGGKGHSAYDIKDKIKKCKGLKADIRKGKLSAIMFKLKILHYT